MNRETRSRQAGFSLLEVMLAVTILAGSLLVLGAGLHSANAVSRQVQDDLAVQMRAQDILDLTLVLPAGTALDPNPTAAQLDEFFDDDDEPGDITLHQLGRAPVLLDGWEFTLASFPVEGTWRVRVDFDLNGDGLIGAARAADFVFDSTAQAAIASMETDSNVFVIRVFFNEQLILATNRQVEVSP